MSFVVDASVAIKWVVEEPGTAEALALRAHRLIAPDLLVAECANILWKKTLRRELDQAEALLAAQLLERADIELVPMRSLLRASAELAIQLSHPAYDCVYLALAGARSAPFVTADVVLVNKVKQTPTVTAPIRSLQEAAALSVHPGDVDAGGSAAGGP